MVFLNTIPTVFAYSAVLRVGHCIDTFMLNTGTDLNAINAWIAEDLLSAVGLAFISDRNSILGGADRSGRVIDTLASLKDNIACSYRIRLVNIVRDRVAYISQCSHIHCCAAEIDLSGDPFERGAGCSSYKGIIVVPSGVSTSQPFGFQMNITAVQAYITIKI